MNVQKFEGRPNRGYDGRFRTPPSEGPGEVTPRAAYVWGRPRNISTPRLSFGSLPPRFSPRREGDEPKGSQRGSPGTRRAECPKIVVSRKPAQRDSAKEHPGYTQTHPLAAQRAPDCDQCGTDRVRSTLPTPRRGSARGAKQSDPVAAWFLDGPPQGRRLKNKETQVSRTKHTAVLTLQTSIILLRRLGG